jgi:hypothetical protein
VNEIEAIRARHEAWESRVGRFGTPSHACVDRGTLLDMLDATLTLDEAGVERLAAALVPFFDGEYPETARAIIERLRGEA